MEIFRHILRLSLSIGLLLFIVYGAFGEKGRFVRNTALTVTSFILFSLFVIAFIIDRNFDRNSKQFDDIIYYLLMGITGICTLVFLVFSVVNRRFIPVGKPKKKMVYTYHRKNEYLYVLYRFEDVVYLQKENNSGIKYKMKKKQFADEALQALNKSMDLFLPDEIKRTGMVDVKGDKTDDVYYCYLIDLKGRIENDLLKEVNVTEIPELEMNDRDRFIIYSCLMETDFHKNF